jgi:hypothetical protein
MHDSVLSFSYPRLFHISGSLHPPPRRQTRITQTQGQTAGDPRVASSRESRVVVVNEEEGAQVAWESSKT